MGRWANKYVIGLTGNIATGKSVVRQMLQHLEAYTIDADSLSHRAMAPGAPAYKPIIDTFGQFILDADKNINRAMLGNIVFSSPDALARLEAIVHPVVGGAVNALITRAQQKFIVVEAIKLLEGDLGKGVDEVWVVDASPETQVKRLIEKRKMSDAEARQRVAAQNAQADKLAKANVVIKNDGNIEDTWKQVQAAWTAIQRKLAGTAPAAPAPAAAAPAQPAAATPAKPPQTKRLDPNTPMPAAPATAAPVAAAPAANVTVTIKRGMPTNADVLAEFISKASGNTVSRMDIMMAFGQKSYLLAQDQADRVLAVMGWQVENLITRVDEFYIAPNAPAAAVIESLVTAVEAASKDLQSEVAYFFLPEAVGAQLAPAFEQHGYEVTVVEQIKIPAWREAVQEIITEFKAARIFGKKLREDRVLKPI
ncbi:MAG: dephospho-CoA kinase [Anaerolineae bacterium]